MPLKLMGTLLPALLATALSKQPAPPPEIHCAIVFKPSLALSYRPEQQAKIVLKSTQNQATTQLGDFQFQAHLDEDQRKGRSLQLIVTPSGTNLPIASQLYQLDRAPAPRHQTSERHGFTGLNFVMNPKSTSTLEYYCTDKP